MNASAKIIEETRNLLLNRPISLTLDIIAEKIEVSQSWLVKFGAGTTDNPRIRQLFALKEFLENYKKN